ncbi:MAG: hypothetical protein KBT31_04150, partial [Firmicutes bacterium]|nr:hypothetical protein [Candidatus Colimorpha enterica]
IIALLAICSCNKPCEHVAGDWIVDVESTCTAEGSKHQICQLCGETLQVDVIPVAEHTFGEWRTISYATCTSSGTKARVYACGKKETETISALGHTTSTGKCSRCGKDFGNWEKNNYVDEFKRPKSETYISNIELIVGTFSNSATSNSKLCVLFAIDYDHFGFALYEYGTHQVKTGDKYTVTILDDQGKKYTTIGYMDTGVGRILLSRWKGEYVSVTDLLRKNKKLTFYVKEDTRYGYASTYLFTVESSNFKSICPSNWF